MGFSMSELMKLTEFAGLLVFAFALLVKTYDAFKNKNVRSVLMGIFRSKGALDATIDYIRALDAILGEALPGMGLCKKIIVFLNGSLLLSISLIAEQAATADDEARKSKTIVGVMLGEKLRKSSMAQVFLGLSLIVNIVFAYFFGLPHSGVVYFFVGVGLLAIHVDHKLIEHRIRNGWYGKNEFESLEIIEFILSHASKDDFNDSGGLKKVIPTPEVSKKESIVIANGVTA